MKREKRVSCSYSVSESIGLRESIHFEREREREREGRRALSLSLSLSSIKRRSARSTHSRIQVRVSKEGRKGGGGFSRQAHASTLRVDTGTPADRPTGQPASQLARFQVAIAAAAAAAAAAAGINVVSSLRI